MPKGFKARWKDEYYVEVFRLAKSGMPDQTIAKTLGVKAATLRRWCEEKPALAKALEDARSESAAVTFKEYVYGRLPEKLRDLWEELTDPETEDNPIERMEALLRDAGKRGRQHLFLYALVNGNFNLSEACRQVNINRHTYNKWVTSDPEFAELMDEIDWHKKNFFEGAFVASVARGETAAVVHAAKTYIADRGYGTKLTVSHEGTVEHEHRVTIDDLKLPLEVRKQLLEAVRKQQEQLAITAGDVLDAEVEE